MIENIPSLIYYIVGFVIITNLGAIGTVIFYGARAVWELSNIIHRISEVEKDIGGVGKKGREQDALVKQHEIRLTKIETRMEHGKN
jgi:hypothetical protein